METQLTVMESCRQQGRYVFGWVSTVVQSRFASHPCLPLFPEA